jgi:transcriptional regulator with XRE-family HTH domain
MREPVPLRLSFARAVRKLRRDRFLSQEALGIRSGVSAKHIGEIERAKKEPGITTAENIARGLDMTLRELLQFAEKGA